MNVRDYSAIFHVVKIIITQYIARKSPPFLHRKQTNKKKHDISILTRKDHMNFTCSTIFADLAIEDAGLRNLVFQYFLSWSKFKFYIRPTVKSPPPHGPTLSPLPKDRRKGLVRRPKGVPRGRPQTRTDNTVRSTARVRTQGRKMGADSKDRRYGRCEEK